MSRAEMRRGARLSAVQALYEMEIGGRGVTEAMAEFEAFWIGQEVEEIELPKAEIAFFRDLLGGVVREQRLVDRTVDRLLAEGWPLKRVEAVVRAIFRAGAYELAFRKDVPARAVISEYVAVARAPSTRARRSAWSTPCSTRWRGNSGPTSSTRRRPDPAGSSAEPRILRSSPRLRSEGWSRRLRRHLLEHPSRRRCAAPQDEGRAGSACDPGRS